METCEHIRPAAIYGWLEQRGYVAHAREALTDTPRPVLTGPRYGLVHGTLSGLGFPTKQPNLFEAPNWTWGKIRCGEQVYGLTAGKGVLPADQLAGIFDERHPRVRALRMGTGSLYYLKDDLRLADRMPDGRISLWADITISELRKAWREQFEGWAKAGLKVGRVDLDMELQKQWFHFYLLRNGSDWLPRQMEDYRWLGFADRYFPHLTKADWDTFTRWGKDERTTQWNAVAELRTLEYFGALRHTLREFWPDCVVGTSNGQYQDYLRFGQGRRFPWGCGSTLGDYSSSKIYTQHELDEAESAVAASTKGYVTWLQDNPLDRAANQDKAAVWSDSGQANTLRHAILLCGDLAPVLSVDDGKPSAESVDSQGRTVLQVFSDMLKDCDKITGQRLGLPLPPEPAQDNWRETVIDLGDRLVKWVSYVELTDPPESAVDGWRPLSKITEHGCWWVRA